MTMLVTDRQTFRINVYGMGKSREGVEWVTVQVGTLRNVFGPDWSFRRLAIDGPLGSASFGKPYTFDGIEYVRVYNGPPPKSLSELRKAAANAAEAYRVAKIAWETAQDRSNLALKDLNAAGLFQNEKKREHTLAERALSEAESRTYDASKCSIYIDGRKV